MAEKPKLTHVSYYLFNDKTKRPIGGMLVSYINKSKDEIAKEGTFVKNLYNWIGKQDKSKAEDQIQEVINITQNLPTNTKYKDDIYRGFKN